MIESHPELAFLAETENKELGDWALPKENQGAAVNPPGMEERRTLLASPVHAAQPARRSRRPKGGREADDLLDAAAMGSLSHGDIGEGPCASLPEPRRFGDGAWSFRSPFGPEIGFCQ